MILPDLFHYIVGRYLNKRIELNLDTVTSKAIVLLFESFPENFEE
jgi:hypothetical protein